MNEITENKLAVLIDADNISSRYIKNLLMEISRYGTPTIKRIYGDWTKPELGGWKNSLLEHAITPIQQYGYTSGKNSTDSAMIIDAMDVLYTSAVDGFCIVSSDSDFTRLAIRLREAGKLVYGIGERKTPGSFIAACSRFIYIEILSGDESTRSEVSKEKNDKSEGKSALENGAHTGTLSINEKDSVSLPTKALTKLISSSVSDLSDEDGWAYLAAIGANLNKKQPDFDPRNYGYQRLTPLLRSLDAFEFDERVTGNSKVKHIFIRNKSEDKIHKSGKSGSK